MLPAIMSPLFLALGSLGGLAMGVALRLLGGHRTELRAVAALTELRVDDAQERRGLDISIHGEEGYHL